MNISSSIVIAAALRAALKFECVSAIEHEKPSLRYRLNDHIDETKVTNEDVSLCLLPQNDCSPIFTALILGQY